VEVYGDGFRMKPVTENPTGVTPVASPAVEVLFDTEPGLNVRVLKSNRLLVDAPPSPLTGGVVRVQGSPSLTFAPGPPATITRATGSWLDDGFRAGQLIRIARSTSNDGERTLAAVTATVLTLVTGDTLVAEGPAVGAVVESKAHGEGVVDVTVRNLDDAGVPIPGESVTVPRAFAYRRPQLADEAHLTRLVRQFIREWRRQVLPNTVLSVHTEFDATTGDGLNITELATLPGVALVGPAVTEDRFYSLNGQLEVVLPSGEVLVYDAPYTVDMGFQVIGVSDSQVELLNLLAAATQFVDRNPYIYLDRDPADLSRGKVRYEFDFAGGGGFEVAAGTNISNLRSFSGTVIIRGVDIEDIAGFPGSLGRDLATTVEDVDAGLAVVGVQMEVEQLGETYDVGPSPGGEG